MCSNTGLLRTIHLTLRVRITSGGGGLEFTNTLFKGASIGAGCINLTVVLPLYVSDLSSLFNCLSKTHLSEIRLQSAV